MSKVRLTVMLSQGVSETLSTSRNTVMVGLNGSDGFLSSFLDIFSCMSRNEHRDPHSETDHPSHPRNLCTYEGPSS